MSGVVLCPIHCSGLLSDCRAQRGFPSFMFKLGHGRLALGFSRPPLGTQTTRFPRHSSIVRGPSDKMRAWMNLCRELTLFLV